MWRGGELAPAPVDRPFVRPSLCSAVPLFGRPFVRLSLCLAVPLFDRPFVRPSLCSAARTCCSGIPLFSMTHLPGILLFGLVLSYLPYSLFLLSGSVTVSVSVSLSLSLSFHPFFSMTHLSGILLFSMTHLSGILLFELEAGYVHYLHASVHTYTHTLEYQFSPPSGVRRR